MNKQQNEKMQQYLSILVGQPLCFLFRCMDMLCFQFGDIIDKPVMSIDESGNIVRVQEKAGSYSLHAQSSYRMICSNEIMFAKGDYYQPSSEALEKMGIHEDDDLPDDFDCSIPGSNRLDEIIQSKFASLDGFTVQSVSINRLGDVRIKFCNGYELQTMVDVSGAEECWRFFRAGDEDHVVVTGEGLAVNE